MTSDAESTALSSSDSSETQSQTSESLSLSSNETASSTSLSSSTATSNETSTSASSETPSSSSTSSSAVSSSDTVTSTSSSSTSLSSSEIYDYTGYYASIAGVSDANLLLALRSVIRAGALDGSGNLVSVTYGDARYILDESDRDPNNANNLILVYSQLSVSGVWDAGATWTREHVWPQSLMNVSVSNSSKNKGADLHNLKPESDSVNSSRGNKYFAETTTSATYAPPNAVKGDVARILLYMITMYPDLSLVDLVSGNPATYQMAQFSLMIKWHLQDPVDAFESNRNQVIFSYQGNRNPYIDHEELVCRIWANSNASTQSYCAA